MYVRGIEMSVKYVQCSDACGIIRIYDWGGDSGGMFPMQVSFDLFTLYKVVSQAIFDHSGLILTPI